MGRRVSVRGGVVATRGLRNELTGRNFSVSSRELGVRLDGDVFLTNKDFRVARVLKGKGRGGRLTVDLRNRDFGLQVRVTYDVAAREPYMRKRLEVLAGEHLVRELRVDDMAIRGARRFRFGGFGQPIFVENELFLGLEYPAGYNLVEGRKRIILRHHPGRSGRVKSKSAVIGVCPDTVNNRVKDWFLKYIDANRGRPIRKFYSEYANMVQEGGARHTELRTWCFDTAKEMFLDQGLPIDSIQLSTSQYWVDPQSVVGELPEKKQAIPLSLLKREARRNLGAGMGIHLNTGGGRSSSDHAWFAEHFDMIDERYYCIADPRVKRELKKNLLHLVRKYGVQLFSFDWLWQKVAWECGRGNHRGHIRGVKYGREAITDAMIEVLMALRKANPDIVLQDLEVEHSPWWLLYGEALWSYAGEGRGLQHDYIDGSLYGWARKTVFPLSDIWYAINIPFGCGMPDRKGELSFTDFVNSLVMSYMRGSQMEEIDYYLKNFTAREKRAYAQVMHWARARTEVILANTTFVLGDPNKLETYGLSHFAEDNRGVTGIYNPAPWRAERVTLVLDEKAHFYERGEPCRLRIVYPYEQELRATYRYGDELDLTVQGGEVLVVEVQPAGDAACGSDMGQAGRGKELETIVSGLKVKSVKGTRTRRPSVSIEARVDVPEGETVRLHAICDTDFEEDSFTEMEGKELEAQLEELVEERKISSAAKRKEYLGSFKRELFMNKVETAARFSMRLGGRKVALGARKGHWAKASRVVWTGAHPRRKSRPYRRAWVVSPDLRSGRIRFEASSEMATSKIRVWLEREIPVDQRRSANAAPHLFGQWSRTRRVTVTLVGV